jgi:CxxC motif-containing protein
MMERNTSGIFTTLVRIKGAKYNVIPVKSTEPIDKSLWIECSKALSRIYVGAPIEIGDIVCKNILNTGVNIVCTKSFGRE